MKLPPHPQNSNTTKFYCRQQEKPVKTMAEAVLEAVNENEGKKDIAVAVVSWQKRGFFFEEWRGDSHSVKPKFIDVEFFKTLYLPEQKRPSKL
ncbi:hypothetical protein TNIN_43471 [Trichonephila inaurata madagascariensis]|uniref:Uncharacterized protein n=1 Tax=Trichonephila inaurata madagascariensis TaxID=2747483 RepID=A0A8X6YJ44_9ARAC|nr:hypothetical protein TNIN_43471 [Trichonephila inaurata madagascariensis]